MIYYLMAATIERFLENKMQKHELKIVKIITRAFAPFWSGMFRVITTLRAKLNSGMLWAVQRIKYPLPRCPPFSLYPYPPTYVQRDNISRSLAYLLADEVCLSLHLCVSDKAI